MDSKNLYKSIMGIAIEYKTSIRGFSPSNNGKLKDSIEIQNRDNTGFEIEGNSYFKFLDKGVNGKKVSRGSIFSYTTKKPPISDIEDWAKKRSINVYALQNSLFNKGIEPRDILDKAVNNVKNVEERITEGFIKDIQEEFKQMNKDGK